jgi:hypothetical protein
LIENGSERSHFFSNDAEWCPNWPKSLIKSGLLPIVISDSDPKEISVSSGFLFHKNNSINEYEIEFLLFDRLHIFSQI